MITFLNRLANSVARQGRMPRRIVAVLKKYCWIRRIGLWHFDLTRPDAPWRRFRQQNDNTVRWEKASPENCRVWGQSGADGYIPWQCEWLIRLIEEGHLVLVGYDNLSDGGDPQVPDCYVALAFGHKTMTKRCSFCMEPDEGMILNAYTRERSRRRKLATKILAELCCLAEERGLTKVYTDIDLSNTASQRAVENAGGVRIRNAVIDRIYFCQTQYILARGPLKDRFRKL